MRLGFENRICVIDGIKFECDINSIKKTCGKICAQELSKRRDRKKGVLK